jgi:hypothetical protein
MNQWRLRLWEAEAYQRRVAIQKVSDALRTLIMEGLIEETVRPDGELGYKPTVGGVPGLHPWDGAALNMELN